MSRQRRVLRLLAGGRLGPDHPRAAEVGVVAAVLDAGVDPQHVALGQRPLGAQQRAGDVAVGGPRQLGLVVGHDLPDRVEDVGLGAQLEHAVEEGGGQVDLAGPRHQPGLHVGHRLLGDPEAVAEAGELVGRLDDAGGAHHLARRPRRPVGEQQRAVVVHRAGHVVDRDGRGRRDERGELAGEGGDALVDVEVGRTVEVVVVEPELGGRVGEERREQVGRLVVGEHDGDRALDVAPPGVAQRPGGPGGVGDVAVAQQHQRVDALLRHRRPEPGAALAPHARDVGLGREVERAGGEGGRRPHQESRPRNACTFVLTIFTASSGPTASTTLASDSSEYPNVLSLCG